MAHVAVIGAGLAGLPTAYELRHILPRQHRVTLISDKPNFTFTPSLPWVAFDLTPLERVQLDVGKLLKGRNIDWIHGKVNHIDPENKTLVAGEQTLEYDYVVVATGPELATDAIAGLGPENGYTQSVCNPHHALMAKEAWQKFLQDPGPLVVGAVPGASCFGPAYEFALLADYVLRRKGMRDRVPITFVTPEPYVGHLGIGGMANSAELVIDLLENKGIRVLPNTAVKEIHPEHMDLDSGEQLPFKYSMLLPPFRGPAFLREAPELTNPKGFVPVTNTYQHPKYESVYSAGVIVEINPPEKTPLPVGVPKTGQMTEAMGMAAAHNIAIKLGVSKAKPVQPTLEAICIADFGDTGIVFVADPVLPDPKTGTRRRAITKRGKWVSWSKTAFETFFLSKMRFGLAVPWFERWGLRFMGLSLVEPLDTTRETGNQAFASKS
jgi:sulfide:quinone oxidoreductase